MRYLFCMSPSFIRTRERTNPYFDPIVSVCEKSGLDWRVIVPCKHKAIGYSKDHVIDARFFEICGIWFWRVAHLLFPKAKTKNIYENFGKVWRLLSFGKYRADVILSVGGQYSEQLQGTNPKAKFIDLQHGVIYSNHQGYFDANGVFGDRVRNFERELWVYGQGYADCFFKNPENHKWLDGRVKVIGDVVRAGARGVGVAVGVGVEGSGQRNLIVIASQMTTDFDIEMLAKVKSIYERFMGGLKGAKGVRVVFRHHPRFGNAIDLSDWKSRYDWVDFDDKRPWSDIYAEALCVATINSTCAFDAAAQGVPTVLLDGSSLGWNNLMVDEYDYPLRDLSVNEILAMPEEDWSIVRDKLKKWYNTYYTPFSPERALRLLKGEM